MYTVLTICFKCDCDLNAPVSFSNNHNKLLGRDKIVVVTILEDAVHKLQLCACHSVKTTTHCLQATPNTSNWIKVAYCRPWYIMGLRRLKNDLSSTQMQWAVLLFLLSLPLKDFKSELKINRSVGLFLFTAKKVGTFRKGLYKLKADKYKGLKFTNSLVFFG